MVGSSPSAQVVCAAMQQLNWISTDFNLTSEGLVSSHANQSNSPQEPRAFSRETCWLAWMTSMMPLGCDSNSDSISTPEAKFAPHAKLPYEIRFRLRELQRDGWVLWDRWPRESSTRIKAWLGPRLYLTSPSVHRLLSEKVHSIVCSQMGRDYRNMPCWPALLDWAIRSAQRDSAGLIVTEGTTLDEPTRQFAQAAAVPLIELNLERPFRFGKDSAKLVSRKSGDCDSKLSSEAFNPAAVEWLLSSLSHLVASDPSAISSEQGIWISPLLCDHSQRDSLADQANENLEALVSTPLRDRVCVALADRVTAVSIKPSGTIATLLQNRLSDTTFPTGSCFIAMPNYRFAAKQDWKPHQVWLDRGAVGYLVDIESSVGLNNQLSRCTSVSITLQPCLSLSNWLQRQRDSWSNLTHCTRGNSAAWPQESTEGFVRRVWNKGNSLGTDPFLTLMNILQERCLRGSNWMTRTQTPMVSLSAAPIEDLLARRTFRTHLGRWDWEPYGIIFRQSCLAAAHAVTYGPKTEFEKLPADMQLFYQPNDGRQDWSDEQEYRFVGSIDLASLPSHAAVVFTQTEIEARQAAAISPFPVIWVRGTENGN